LRLQAFVWLTAETQRTPRRESTKNLCELRASVVNTLSQ
jgi:hypothetical protein